MSKQSDLLAKAKDVMASLQSIQEYLTLVKVDQDLLTSKLIDIEKRVQTLENRYSEILYKISCK